MYQNFTGASRRPRQVNLSGIRSNPFAANAPLGQSSALAHAQAERQQRQRSREEQTAVGVIQRTWRGHRTRARLRNQRRAEWDTSVGQGAILTEGRTPFASEKQAADAVQTLLSFARVSERSDHQRIVWLMGRLQTTTASSGFWTGTAWVSRYAGLGRLCLGILEQLDLSDRDLQLQFLQYSQAMVMALSTSFGTIATEYFHTTALLYALAPSLRSEAVVAMRLGLHQPANQMVVYRAFVGEVLTRPVDPENLAELTRTIKRTQLLAAAVDLTATTLNLRRAIWLLGQLVAVLFGRTRISRREEEGQNTGFILVAARLLAAIADDVDVERSSLPFSSHEFDAKVLAAPPLGKLTLNSFLKESLAVLVQQSTIKTVLSEHQLSGSGKSNELATYVLTLLRVFYAHADDVRMWLYLGSSNHNNQDTSPILYFWKEAKKSKVVQSITKDPRSVVSLIITSPVASDPIMSQWQRPRHLGTEADIAEEWKVVLIFLELYTFVLKIMDDEEFLGRGEGIQSSRSNPLSLAEVSDLVSFLKHLGFALYHYGKEIAQVATGDTRAPSRQSVSRFFDPRASTASTSSTITEAPPLEQLCVAGLVGITIPYVKGVVTGLVRSIYERDSRRNFLPKGHWLMVEIFDMSKFISEVVAEEESRHQLENMDDEDDDNAMSDTESDLQNISSMNSNLQRMAQAERMQRAQKKASRKRYLELVAPRLEVLQHMPFVIPFDTRVQIFREFVRLDQVNRRFGQVDPDVWRHMTMMRSTDQHHAMEQLGKHHAKIRRKHEFEDAMEQFYDLGAELKEPIQITFVDEFDMVEAGIDGGGVTKEFLTLVTADIFSPDQGLFTANSEHLLYPNPTKLFEHAWQKGPDEADVLEAYEFAGRIIGKCLYEGILVDIAFAGFFLIKWALAGTAGSGSLDSGYRANINDLKDLDAELYKGLIYLKNYRGDVQDLALTFTVTDEVRHWKEDRMETIEKELVANGAEIPVTNENKLIYISRVARYRLQTQSVKQTTCFLKGLATIIRPSWLSMFNQSEIQNLVGGSRTGIDVEDLRRNTEYGGVYVIGDDGEEHPSVKLFWQVMQELDDEDKGQVLKFVTSTPRAPLLGFGSLKPLFSIRDSGTDEKRFPTTSTCINLLKLPRYTSVSALKERLLYAVNSGAGFDLS